MKVAVIGTGNMGGAIAQRLVAGGHEVYVVGSAEEKARDLVQQLRGQGPGTIEAAASRDAAARGCDMVILATWFEESARIAVQLSDVVRGKIVVDIANPFNATFDGLITDYDTSAAEEIQRRMPGVSVVKAFNTTFAPSLARDGVDGAGVDVLVAADDEQARARVAELVESTGLRAIDAGALANARTLERLALLMVEVQGRYGLEFQAGVKVLPTRTLPFPSREVAYA